MTQEQKIEAVRDQLKTKDTNDIAARLRDLRVMLDNNDRRVVGKEADAETWIAIATDEILSRGS